jgi:DNA-binding MarR family transcriptional regulator
VSPLTPHQVRHWRILSEFESRGVVSQRALARKLGIALGLANQLVRELAARRLIRCAPSSGSRAGVEYRLTGAGRRYQAVVSRARMRGLVEAYAEARERIGERLNILAASRAAGAPETRVVFYDDGSGISELGWMCLQGTGLRLVGIVGESVGTMYDIPIQPCERLRGRDLSGQPFDRLVVMSFGPVGPIRARLRRLAVPRGVPFWL